MKKERDEAKEEVAKAQEATKAKVRHAKVIEQRRKFSSCALTESDH